MSLSVIDSLEGLDAIQNQWNRLHTKIHGTVFQTFSWNRHWWNVYRNGYTLRVVTVWQGDELLAVLPLFLERICLGILHLQRLRLLGTRHIYGEYTPLLSGLHQNEINKELSGWLERELTEGRCDIVELFRFSPTSVSVAKFLNTLRSAAIGFRYDPKCIPHVTMKLASNWEEYIESLSGVERTMLRRRQKSLAKAGVTIEKVTDPKLFASAFNDFAALHAATWRPRGREGYFESLDGFENFHWVVTGDLMGQGCARLYFLRAGEKRIAAVQAFFVHDHCCFYLSGLDRSSEFIRYSPGKVLLARVIRDAIEDGCTTFDFQGGDEDYKFRFGGQLSWFPKALMWRKDMSRFKVFIFLALQYVRNNIITVLLEEHIKPSINRLCLWLRLCS